MNATPALTLPDWLPAWLTPVGLPWWAGLLVLVPALLYVLLVVAMPFLVFGTRRRMESVEARLDDVLAELRALTLRLPDGGPLPGEMPYRARPPIAPLPPQEAAAPPPPVRPAGYYREAPPPETESDVPPPPAAAPPVYRFGRRPPPPDAEPPPEPRESPEEPRPRPGSRGEPRVDWPR